jgi:hypothetical protein
MDIDVEDAMEMIDYLTQSFIGDSWPSYVESIDKKFYWSLEDDWPSLFDVYKALGVPKSQNHGGYTLMEISRSDAITILHHLANVTIADNWVQTMDDMDNGYYDEETGDHVTFIDLLWAFGVSIEEFVVTIGAKDPVLEPEKKLITYYLSDPKFYSEELPMLSGRLEGEAMRDYFNLDSTLTGNYVVEFQLPYDLEDLHITFILGLVGDIIMTNGEEYFRKNYTFVRNDKKDHGFQDEIDQAIAHAVLCMSKN